MPALLLERRGEDYGKFPDGCSYTGWGGAGRMEEGRQTILLICPNPLLTLASSVREYYPKCHGSRKLCGKQPKPSELNLENLLWGTFLAPLYLLL